MTVSGLHEGKADALGVARGGCTAALDVIKWPPARRSTCRWIRRAAALSPQNRKPKRRQPIRRRLRGPRRKLRCRVWWGPAEIVHLISVHFPKAAGTSLLSALKTQFADDLWDDREGDPMGDFGPYGRTGVSRRAAVAPPVGTAPRAVHGHFHPLRHVTTPNSVLVTFLRDPVDTLISIYYFWRQAPPGGHWTNQRFWKEKPSVFDLAEWPGLRKLMSDTYFGDFDMGRFSFIGFHDRREADMARLGGLLGFEVPRTYENRTPADPEREELQASAGSLARLRSILSEDVAFYERLRRMRD